MLGTVKAAATGWWERLQRFLLMTILDHWFLLLRELGKNSGKIDKVVKFVKIWKFMSPVLTPLLKFEMGG